MPRRVHASALRKNIYRTLDRVIETGEPVEIERRGHVLKIVPAEPVSKLGRLVRRPGVIKGDPDDLVEIDWSKYWRP